MPGVSVYIGSATIPVVVLVNYDGVTTYDATTTYA